jgi:protein gp37
LSDTIREMVTHPTHQILTCTKRVENLHRLPSLPGHIWIGATAWDQASLDRALNALGRVGHPSKWLSLEPLLGPVSLPVTAPVHWIVAGAETGTGARPCEASWLWKLRLDCATLGIPLWVKQAPNQSLITRTYPNELANQPRVK